MRLSTLLLSSAVLISSCSAKIDQAETGTPALVSRSTLPGSSEFIGCLDGDFKPSSGIVIKKKIQKKDYYQCSDACSAKGYTYSYFMDKGKGVHDCSCSDAGPHSSDYTVQPVGSNSCRIGQTRASLTATEFKFMVCSKGFLGTFSQPSTQRSPLDCLKSCENDEGALFAPKQYGSSFNCRCGGVTNVKSIAACGQDGSEFGYVYKPTNKKKTKSATNKSGKKKLGAGNAGEKGKKVYDNPCDDPDSILGYCGFGEEDVPVFHDRTNL